MGEVMAEVGISKCPTQRSVSSLQEKMLFDNAVILCNKNELLTLILKCPFIECLKERLEIKTGKYYKKVEAKVNEMLSKMKAIGLFKAMIQDLVWPLAYRIIHWKYIYASCNIDNKFLQCFHWTCERRIDSKKTAKSIIENKMIPIGKRFILACSFCLKDEIVKLSKDMLHNDIRYVLQVENRTIFQLCKFWISQLSNDAPLPLQGKIILATIISSIEVTKYFFSLLPEDEKGNAAEICARANLHCLEPLPFISEEVSEIGYFVYSQMTETSKQNFFNSNKKVILLFLLYSPGQDEFFKIFKDNLKDFSKEDIIKWIFIIYYKMRLGIFKDYDYFKLFCRIWGILDESVKSHIIESKLLEHFFLSFISGYFRFLLTKSPSKSMKTSKTKNIIDHNSDKWNLIHFFIVQEIVTAESLKASKEEVLISLRIRKSNKPAWRRLLKFVKDKRGNKNRT